MHVYLLNEDIAAELNTLVGDWSLVTKPQSAGKSDSGS
jgi:hypothetical protein